MKRTLPRCLLVAAFAGAACTQKSDGGDTKAAAGVSASATPRSESVDISSAKAAPDTWMEFAAEEYGFKMRFPVAPKKEALTVPTPLGDIPGVMWLAEAGDEFVGITVMPVSEAMLGDFNVEAALDGGRDGMINNVGGTIVSEKQANFAGHDARAIVARVPNPAGDLDLEARIVWVRPRLYQLIALVPSGSTSTSPQRLFDSFELTSE